jgi:hypothetical protein
VSAQTTKVYRAYPYWLYLISKELFRAYSTVHLPHVTNANACSIQMTALDIIFSSMATDNSLQQLHRKSLLGNEKYMFDSMLI